MLFSFCRKTTMVKHQRRSHQRGIHSSELDDGETSDSDSGESPSTPDHSGPVSWPQSSHGTQHSLPAGHVIHRAHSYSDFNNQQSTGYGLQQPYGAHRHSVSGNAHEYHSIQPIQEQSHHNAVQRAPITNSHSYYIEQNNPGVATMNPNSNAQLHLPTYQIPTQQQDQPRHQSISYPPSHAQQQVLPASVQSSPGGYSSTSGRSPVAQEVYYTHQPAPSHYVVHHSPIEQQQQQPMVHYQPPPMNQAPPQPMVASVSQEQYQQSPQEQQWYTGAPYQDPVSVGAPVVYATTNQIYDPWVDNLKYEEVQAQQLPSARVETL
jgi:hypothetical protein